MFIVNRKDDQIADLESQLQSLKEIADSMKKSLEQQAIEKAKLVNMNSSLQSSLKQKEEQLKEMSNKRSTIHDETGVVLSKLQLSEAAVKTALERRGLNITDLYSRIITLEEDLEKMRRGKNEAEM